MGQEAAGAGPPRKAAPRVRSSPPAVLLRWLAPTARARSLLVNVPSSLVIAFLPRSNYLLISQLQSPSAVILEPPRIKSVTVFLKSDQTALSKGEQNCGSGGPRNGASAYPSKQLRSAIAGLLHAGRRVQRPGCECPLQVS